MDTLGSLVLAGTCVSGAIAAGQTAWWVMDKLVERLGVEPIEWLQDRLRSEP